MTRPTNFDPPVFFVLTELEVGLTFALVAAHADNEEKFQRNQSNARRACDTARRSMRRIELSDDEAAELHELLEELERQVARAC